MATWFLCPVFNDVTAPYRADWERDWRGRRGVEGGGTKREGWGQGADPLDFRTRMYALEGPRVSTTADWHGEQNMTHFSRSSTLHLMFHR